ncbi:MAG: hypothetical protein JSW61_11325 [Candidatus Thorarchaeota archaeon]|nr:MAG: hypothetical protein JSW61_11325 [Candidatus Thorarchaeota archaeon]
MKARFKIDEQWLEKERKSMSKIEKDYKDWEEETLRKARDAKDLRSLREVFYELGDRWEWDQATGAWLSSGEPLDTVGLILRVPGLEENRERFIVYTVLAYSKGTLDEFDHLGDKERVIIEKNTSTGKMVVWSTTGHGSMDLLPTSLSGFQDIDDILDTCFLVAQPGDHALRLEIPKSHPGSKNILEVLWALASGDRAFRTKDIVLLSSEDIEDGLDFKFYRYAKAVVELDRIWTELAGGAVSRAKEAVLDKTPDHIEERNKATLRSIEGLLYVLWFKPAFRQTKLVQRIYTDLKDEPTPTEVQRALIPNMGELLYSLTDVLEKAKYLKWKSVMDRKDFSRSEVFRGVDVSNLAKEAFAVALEDILKEHTLAYIGYPEKATMVDKISRVLFGLAVLPARLVASMATRITSRLSTIWQKEGTREDTSQASETEMIEGASESE